MKAPIAVRLTLALAALLTTAGMAVAQAPGVGPGFGDRRPPMERMLGADGQHGRWWNNPTMIEKLKLTDDQRKAMDSIMQAHREKLIDLRANLDKAELVLQPMMQDDQPNEANILGQIDKVAQARADLEKANARFLLAIRGKLTPDQWKQLQQIRADRMQRGWGRGMGRGQGPNCPNGNCPGMMPQGPQPPAPPAPPSGPATN
ncbi:MAG: Spy/CpxP family protein refolding chaperone [Acidobacteriota bacterium]|nr:Spy/CpxP family protein refolding chaperone [Acidobacteriota bacterium]